MARPKKTETLDDFEPGIRLRKEERHVLHLIVQQKGYKNFADYVRGDILKQPIKKIPPYVGVINKGFSEMGRIVDLIPGAPEHLREALYNMFLKIGEWMLKEGGRA